MRVRLAAAVLVALALVTLSGCRGRDWDSECDLIVNNRSHCDLTVYIDGWEAARVRHGDVRTIEDIDDGRHVLEAKDEAGRIVERRSIDLDNGEDYYWRLDSC